MSQNLNCITFNVASPTAAPQTEAHQTAVSQIVFHEAHIEQILPSPTTYQRKRKTQKCRRTKKDTELPQTSVPLDHGADERCSIREGWQSQVPRHHGGTPTQTRSERVLEQPSEPPLSEGHTSGSGEGSMEHTFELTDNVPPTPHDSPLTGGYTPGSDEGRMKIDELITMCTKLSTQVLDLEKEKDAQAVEILNLKRRENASKQGEISDKLKPMFKDKDFEELDDHIENVEEETVDAAATGVSTVSAPFSTAGVTINVEDSSRIVRPVRSITTLQPLPTIDPKDKGKGILIEEEPVKIKIRDQGICKFQADERQRQEDDTNAALAKQFDEIQARIDVNHELAKEQESAKSDEEAAADYEHEKEELEQIVMKRFEDTIPEGYNLLLWGDLKVMFEPNAEDEIWSNQQDWTLISWKL
ncbi:hypothetical protein Tco_0476218 [Tanacetum coccineum]